MDYTPYRYFVPPRHGCPAPEAMQEKRRGLNPLVDGRVARAAAVWAVVGEGNRFAAAGAVHLNGLVVETLRGFFQEYLESGGAEMVYDALPEVFGRLRHRLRLSEGLAGPVFVAGIGAGIRRPEGFLFLGPFPQ